MLARRLLSPGAARPSLILGNSYYSYREGWLASTVLQPDGYIKFSYPFASVGEELHRNAYGYVSSDETVIPFRSPSFTFIARRWLTPGFDPATPAAVLTSSTINSGSTWSFIQALRDRIVRWEGSARVLRSYDWSGAEIGALTLPTPYVATPLSVDGRWLLCSSEAGYALRTGPRRRTGRDVSFANFDPNGSSYSVASFTLDFTDTVLAENVPYYMRLESSDLSSSLVSTPSDARLDPLVPAGAELAPVWAYSSNPYGPLSVAFQGKDELFAIGGVITRKIWKGANDGTQVISGATYDRTFMALGVKRATGLYKIDKNGTITLENILFQDSDVFGWGVYYTQGVDSPAPGTPRIIVRRSISDPATPYYHEPGDITNSANSVQWPTRIVRSVARLGEYAYVLTTNTSGGSAVLLKLKIGTQGNTSVSSIPSGIFGLVSFPKEGILLAWNQAQTIFWQSKDGGTTWASLGTTYAPTSDLRGYFIPI